MVAGSLAQGGGVKIRQQAPTLDGIRDDHVARYRYAAAQARTHGIICAVDVGCGVGYGSWILATEAGLIVSGYDRDADCIAYGDVHYRHHSIFRAIADLATFKMPDHPPRVRMLAAFEIIEHSADAPAFIARAARGAWLLVGSVPNQEVVPFVPGKVNAEHVRHYTPAEIRAELDAAGWQVVMLGCQTAKRGAAAGVREDTTAGRTLVFVAESKHVSGAAR